MMAKKKYKLDATSRKISGKKVKTLREKGIVPAVIYGKDIDSKNIQMNEVEFQNIYNEAGSSNFIELLVDGEPTTVLVKNVAVHPISLKIEHVEFYQIDQKTEITTDVPLEFIGEPKAVKTKVGLLIIPEESITIRCLPSALPQSIEVDIEDLNEVGDSVLIRDIQLPQGVELDSDVDDNQAVAMIVAPQMEEVKEEVIETSVEDVEITEEKESPEETSEEGGSPQED